MTPPKPGQMGHTLESRGQAMVDNMKRVRESKGTRTAEDKRNVFNNQPAQQRPKVLKNLKQLRKDK
jgi:hypothetical protein